MGITWKRVALATLINCAVAFGLIFSPLDLVPRMIAMLSLDPWSWVVILLFTSFVPVAIYAAVFVSNPRSKWKSEFVVATGILVGLIAGSKFAVPVAEPI